MFTYIYIYIHSVAILGCSAHVGEASALLSSMAKRSYPGADAKGASAAEGASASASTEAPSTAAEGASAFPSVESGGVRGVDADAAEGPPTSTVESGGVRGVSADAAWAEWLNTSPMDYKSRTAAIKAEVKRLKKEAANSQMRAIVNS